MVETPGGDSIAGPLPRHEARGRPVLRPHAHVAAGCIWAPRRRAARVDERNEVRVWPHSPGLSLPPDVGTRKSAAAIPSDLDAAALQLASLGATAITRRLPANREEKYGLFEFG